MSTLLHIDSPRLEALAARLQTELEKYPAISRYLGEFVSQRLRRRGATRGVITGSFFWGADGEADLQRLELVLERGAAHCADFALIFSGRRLPANSGEADAVLLDLLVEVEAFEYLSSNDFVDIQYVPRSPRRTVDFLARRGRLSFAIEATRFRPPISPSKSIPRERVFAAPGMTADLFYGHAAGEPLARTFEDVIIRKNSQLKSYMGDTEEPRKGVVFLSPGRGFFVTRFARRDLAPLPRTAQTVLSETFEGLRREGACDCVDMVVLGQGKGRFFTFPPLSLAAHRRA